MSTFICVPLLAKHLPAVAQIAATAPDPWTQADFSAELSNPLLYPAYTALLGGQPAGFACFMRTHTTADLRLIAVDPNFRRQGIARGLLSHSLRSLAGQGATRCLLEVRAGNQAALALYKAAGFQLLALRPGLYTHPKEDGLLLQKDLL